MGGGGVRHAGASVLCVLGSASHFRVAKNIETFILRKKIKLKTI